MDSCGAMARSGDSIGNTFTDIGLLSWVLMESGLLLLFWLVSSLLSAVLVVLVGVALLLNSTGDLGAVALAIPWSFEFVKET